MQACSSCLVAVDISVATAAKKELSDACWVSLSPLRSLADTAVPITRRHRKQKERISTQSTSAAVGGHRLGAGGTGETGVHLPLHLPAFVRTREVRGCVGTRVQLQKYICGIITRATRPEAKMRVVDEKLRRFARTEAPQETPVTCVSVCVCVYSRVCASVAVDGGRGGVSPAARMLARLVLSGTWFLSTQEAGEIICLDKHFMSQNHRLLLLDRDHGPRHEVPIRFQDGDQTPKLINENGLFRTRDRQSDHPTSRRVNVQRDFPICPVGHSTHATGHGRDAGAWMEVGSIFRASQTRNVDEGGPRHA